MITFAALLLIWLAGAVAGSAALTSGRAEAERREAQRLRDEAWDLRYLSRTCPAGDDDMCGGQGPCDTCPKESA